MLESTSGTQDPAMEDAMGSAELSGSQLTVRSSSQISQGSYDDSTPEELLGMLGPRPSSDEDDAAPEAVASMDDEDEYEYASLAEAAPQAASLMDTCLKCKRPTGETDCIICEQCGAGIHILCLDKPVPSGDWYCPGCVFDFDGASAHHGQPCMRGADSRPGRG